MEKQSTQRRQVERLKIKNILKIRPIQNRSYYQYPFKHNKFKMQENTGIRRNALIFAVLTVIIHVLACFMFGFFFRLPAQSSSGQFYPLFITFAYGAFIIVGFGLLFSYLRKMLWTGMGFTLLITALSIEFYFMINCFWTKAVITHTADVQTRFSDQDKTYNFWLTNLNEPNRYLATLTGGFRCALCNLIAFSSIMGRAGPLEALFVVIVGTIGYELNRQIIQNYNVDSGGANAIFVFGGFMSLVIGILRYLKQRSSKSTLQHQNYSADRFSAAFALIGTLITWIFFPVLALDYIDRSISFNTPYTGAYSIIFALCASTLAAFMLSPIFNNGVLIRDIVYAPIAGGVACATASYWILNPVYSLLTGLVAGAVQVVIMNLVEKKVARERQIFHTFSFSLFGVQGMIGAIFASIWNAVVRSNTYGFQYNFNVDQVFSWVMSLISAPMGLLFGALAGALCMAVGTHTRQDHFDDFTYWINDDGIRLVQPSQQPYMPPVVVQSRPEQIAAGQIGVRQRSHVIKQRRAYL